MTIRPARAADLAAMEAIEDDADVRFEAYPTLALPVDRSMESEILDAISQGLAFVAEEQEMLGFVYASVADDSVFVEELSVRRSAAGRRLGAALLESLESVARRRGLAALTLTTFRDVAWNAPYYRRLGFQEVEAHAGLAEKLEAERRRGFESTQRVAMRREIDPASKPR